jgi:hypothetical protein
MVQIAQMIRAPAAKAEQKNFCHQIISIEHASLRIGDQGLITEFGGRNQAKKWAEP